ncbi:MAG: hydroxymyristoyl-ACP dehydratase [Clostridia bacterium]|nr:hydroxymyristoyl-ACP dehydratase [Clostridia bacterium]
MTNINCLANCVYQKDGKCCLEDISSKTVTLASNCAYFLSNKPVAKK